MNEQASLSHDAISTGFRRELDAALDGLPEHYRHPLVLFHLEGASLDEVARRLDLQPSTLRTRLSRARDMLRHVLVRRGVEVASVAALSSFFAAEAKAAAFTPNILSSVVDAATSNGVGVSSNILQLAGKAACGTKPISITASITSLAVLMKTKATLVTAILVVLATVGTTTYFIYQRDARIRSESQSNDHRLPASPAEGRDGKKRERAPQFLNIEEAEQAMLDIDTTPMFGSDSEEAKRCMYRLRGVSAKIPKVYLSELTARFRKGSDMDLKQYFRQMALYTEWGRLDFEAALADLPRIENAKMRSKAMQNVFCGAAEVDAKAAMKRAETLTIAPPQEFSETERIKLMDSIFDAWIEFDPFSAIEWAKHAQVLEKRRDQWIRMASAPGARKTPMPRKDGASRRISKKSVADSSFPQQGSHAQIWLRIERKTVSTALGNASMRGEFDHTLPSPRRRSHEAGWTSPSAVMTENSSTPRLR